MSAVVLRMATEADAEALLAIYSPYVLESAISFEHTPPTVEEFRGRIRKALTAYPYLVAEDESGILGYAYGGRFQPRASYDWSAETSIYIAGGTRRSGLGRLLYGRLLDILRLQGVRNVYAGISWPNEPSIGFHEAMGYKLVARYSRCGYKLGQWRDVVWMETFLGEHDGPPLPFRPIAEVLGEAGL